MDWADARSSGRARERVAPAFERIASVALALLAFGGAEAVGGNGFIAAFVAGLAVGAVARSACGTLLDFAEAEGQLLTLTVFLVFGAALAAPALGAVTAPQLLYALASLTLVRMLPVALLLAGSGLRGASVLFLGWFGPRGIASVLFLLLALERGGVPAGVAPALAVTVCASVALHGLSAAPGARLYARALERGRSREAIDAMPEMQEVTPLPLRTGGAADADG